jgi:hypothetical protein
MGIKNDANVVVTNAILLQILVKQLIILTLKNVRIIQDKYAVHDYAFTFYLDLLKMLSRKLRKHKRNIQ